MNDKVEFFESSNALDSLRSSDFDANSAYGEVIDNAIQAKATNININFDTVTNRNYSQIRTLAFGDNGIGMDAPTLAKCLKLGWSSRFNDRSGIGRFGVGMVLGAIHECKRIEVYSKKDSNDNWLYTYIDLDEIKDKKIEGIPAPVNKTLPHKYANLVDKNHGTLILWSKYDRQKLSAPSMIKYANEYIGRTFRKFIWDGVTINLDNVEVKAHDPLYLTTAKTAFPNDPPAREYEPFTIKWPIQDSSLHAEYGERGEIKIRMTHLPEELRSYRGVGGSEKSKIRRINEDQQGISILREGREVFFGMVPYWSIVRILGESNKKEESTKNTWRFEPIDRFWGLEISFGAEFDNAFEVKNIKRGARPEPELLQTIKMLISPSRKRANDETQAVWVEKDIRDAEEKNKKDNDLGRHQGRSKAEKAAAKGVHTKSKYDADKTAEEVANKHFDGVGSQIDEQRRRQYIELHKSQPYTIVDDQAGWRGSTFWEVTMGGDKIMMQYNLAHEFFTELKSLESLISEETDQVQLREHATNMSVLVDLLLISFAKTQSGFDHDQEVKIEDLIEMMNESWGQTLKSFVKSHKSIENE